MDKNNPFEETWLSIGIGWFYQLTSGAREGVVAQHRDHRLLTAN